MERELLCEEILGNDDPPSLDPTFVALPQPYVSINYHCQIYQGYNADLAALANNQVFHPTLPEIPAEQRLSWRLQSHLRSVNFDR